MQGLLQTQVLFHAGVLYTPPPQLFTVAPASGPYAIPTPSVAHEQPPAPSAAAAPRYAHPGLGAITRRGRSARRDPLEPKQNKTPFNFFSIDARARAKAEHPLADQKVLPALSPHKIRTGMAHCSIACTPLLRLSLECKICF